jgi:hypothetical protein
MVLAVFCTSFLRSTSAKAKYKEHISVYRLILRPNDTQKDGKVPL